MFEKLLLKFLKLKTTAKRKNKKNNIEFDSPPKYNEAGSIVKNGKYQNIKYFFSKRQSNINFKNKALNVVNKN